MPNHTVKQGECLESIGAVYGFNWKTIWNHAENSDLRDERNSPNQLLPGDSLFIPDLTPGEDDATTEERHRYRLKCVPSILKVRLLNNGEPRRNEKWQAVVDGKIQNGATDDDGLATIRVMPRTGYVKFTLESGVAYRLLLRELDPLKTISGVQARLNNLGYESGTVDGIQGPITTGAIKRFQADYPPLEVDGIVGEHTRAKLKEVYGC